MGDNWKALLVADVDGCLTDGNVLYLDNNIRGRLFNVRDGMAFSLLKENNIFPIVVSGEYETHMQQRFEKLRVPFFQAENKLAFLEGYIDLMEMQELPLIAFGDDLNDFELLKRANFSGCPADAQKEVRYLVSNRMKEMRGYVCNRNGGERAFREFCNFITSIQDLFSLIESK